MKHAGAYAAQFGILLIVSVILVSGIWYFSMQSNGKFPFFIFFLSPFFLLKEAH